MRILVLSNIEWSDNNAFGNTVSNFFGEMQGVEVASVYRRNSKPSNNVCKKYYKISYTSIIKNFFKKENIGEYFEYESPRETKTEVSNEQKAIGLIHKFKLNKLIYFIEDMLFSTKKWENKRFKQFITEYNPNVLFLFARANKLHNLFIKSILKYVPKCRVVIFIADDIYGANATKKHKKILTEQFKLASKVYAITPSLKEVYENIFGCKIDVLTKGCEFNLPVTKKENSTKTIVYAGNLLYGRDNTLKKLAREIANHNDKNENKLYLKVYSPTIIEESTKNALNIRGAVEFCGAKPFFEIVEILNSADLVLQVESFDKAQQKIVKHSFSTKITDCMQSGSVLLAIGPKDVASIRATKEIDGCFTAENEEEISAVIKKIAAADLYQNALKIREYAKEHFCIEKIQEKLLTDFKNIM